MCPGRLCKCAWCIVYVRAQGALSMCPGVHCPCEQGAVHVNRVQYMCAGCIVHVRRVHCPRAQGALSICARRVHCTCARAGMYPGGHHLGGHRLYAQRHCVEPPSIPTHHHHVHPYLLHNHRHMHKVDNVHVNTFPFPPLPFLPSPGSLRTQKHRPYNSAVAIHQF